MQLRSDDGNTVVEVGTGEVTIKANTITVTGQQVNVTGSTQVVISGNDQTTIDGVNFLEHTHSGVTAGGGVTGPVVP
jgi:aerobic-type carbon monoxide dehydrogenase small subunit (CoxS/CutS family)